MAETGIMFRRTIVFQLVCLSLLCIPETAMMTSATVPVIVTDEAAARIAEMGFDSHVQRMIEHARQNLPDLEHIDVVLYDRYELGDKPGLAIDVYSRRAYDRLSGDERRLIRWMVTEFPPEVLQHIIMDYHPGDGHAG
jgi:hypothetical protein